MAQEKIYLKINTEADRATVAAILFRNGYSVAPVRIPRSGSKKTFDYCVAVWEGDRTVDPSGEEAMENDDH